MSKPDWSAAPGWAAYLAMDSDGFWYWYQNEPNLRREDGLWNRALGEVALAGSEAQIWKQTLEARP